MDKKFWATTFTLTGAIVGAGILGLPYVFSKSGVWIGLGWLLVIGFIKIYTNLCLGEVSLRTKGRHQLPGYAGKYLGKYGEGIMFFVVIFGLYSALLAYLIGEGQSLSMIFTGGIEYGIYFAIGFWLIMTLLLQEGLKGLKKVETWGVIAIILLILAIAVYYFPGISIKNYAHSDFSHFFLPFGVVLFSMMGFTSIPELRMEIKGSEKKFRKAIILGCSIPIALYIIFSFVFVGVLGNEVPQVATLGFGNLVTLLGIFTMFTSYLVLSFSIRDIFEYDLKVSKLSRFLFVSLIPIGLYLGITYFNLLKFIEILGIGGAISGGIGIIMILFITQSAKKKCNRKPEFSMPLNWFVVALLTLIFILGILFEIFL